MLTVLVVVAYAFIGFIEWKPLLKNGDKKGFAVNLGLTVISFVIAILLSLNVKIPSPAKPISDLVRMLFLN